MSPPSTTISRVNPDPLRFADILTTASAVANYHGVPDVTATHLLDAIAILREEKSLDDLGRPVSPLVPRRPGAGVDPPVRDLVQRWWHTLGEDVNATLTAPALASLTAELHALTRGTRDSPSPPVYEPET